MGNFDDHANNPSKACSNCSIEELVNISPLRFRHGYLTRQPPQAVRHWCKARLLPKEESLREGSSTSELILYAPEVVTQNTEPSASNPATSAGVARVSPAKSVSSSSPTTLPTTNSSEPTP